MAFFLFFVFCFFFDLNRYVVTMLSDSRALVRATAIRTLAYVVSAIPTNPILLLSTHSY